MSELTGAPETVRRFAAAARPPVPLACPECKRPLVVDEPLRCPKCDIFFAADDGVPVFAPEQTTYRDYDTFWCDERPFEQLSSSRHFLYSHLRYWSFRERRFFEKHVKSGSTVLDLGCWTGNRAYTPFGSMVGIDLCLSAARKAAKKYDFAVQGTATKLPFINDSFDCVLSSHVFGHLSGEEKDKTVSEIFRVLKPGGLSLHIIETDSTGCLVSSAKKWPELYGKYFLDRYGHVDLELASAVITRFQRQGFVLEKVIKMDSLVPPPWYYQQYFDNEYAQADPILNRKLHRANMLCSTIVSRFVLGFVFGIFHSTWEQWFSHLDDSMHISISLSKPAGEKSCCGPEGPGASLPKTNSDELDGPDRCV